MLQNADALAALRDSRGGHDILSEGDHILWAAEGPGETRYVAAFNRGKDVMDVSIDTQNAGLPARPTGRLQELWSGERVDVRPVDKQSVEARGVAPGSSAIDLTIPAHGAKLLRYRE